jgi:glycerophosphoryl diester phosphodiesterase
MSTIAPTAPPWDLNLPPWPYPFWIAHRGAGKLAPENTLAAFRLGASHGYRMFECDVKLSSDGVPFLLHDATLQRTTNARAKLGAGNSAVAGDHPWGALSQLDAGSWHSRAFAGEPMASLDNVAAFCLRNGYHLNIEIKPTPGLERHTGEIVANHAARLWKAQAVQPLLTSFEVDALRGAHAAQPSLPRGLLLDHLWTGWLETALTLDCVAVVCNYQLWDTSSVTQAHGAGLRCLSYTVNDEWAVQYLLGLQTDGIITDRVDLFTPA